MSDWASPQGISDMIGDNTMGGAKLATGKSRRTCPKCGGQLSRVKRRLLDRLTGWMTGIVRRYRCDHPDCAWEGNLKVDRDGHYRP